MLQFALISLIPGLLRRLQDAADPDFDSYEKDLVMPTSLRTSERNSCTFSVSKFRLSGLTGWQCSLTWVFRCSCRYCSTFSRNYFFGLEADHRSLLSIASVKVLDLFPHECEAILTPRRSSLRALYAIAAAGRPGRLRYEVIHRRINQFSSLAAERSLQ